MSTSPAPPSLRFPAGILRVWRPEEEASARRETADRLRAAIESTPGAYRLGPGLFAVLPLPGDGDVLDAAAACGRRFLAATARRGKSGRSGLSEVRVLVHPGEVEVAGDSVHLLPDALVRRLDERPPPLPGGSVFLTARAGQSLEQPWQLRDGPALPEVAGRAIPTFQLGDREALRPPWRNHSVWGRKVKWMPRPELEAELADLASRPAVRVLGMLGSGKTRAVLQTRATGFSAVHVGVAPMRAGLAPTPLRLLARCLGIMPEGHPELRREAENLARELSSAPAVAGDAAAKVAQMVSRIAEGRASGDPSKRLVVVLDDLERGELPEWELVSALLDVAHGGAPLRLVLVGRDGPAWPGAPEELAALPRVEIPSLDEEACRNLIAQMLPGVTLPERVHEGLVQASGGNPFTIEEAVLSLIQQNRIRRFYGTFVFRSAEEVAPFIPSSRLAAQIEAEGGRLGDPFPLRLLAAAGEPLPPREIASAGALADETVALDWEVPFIEAGWLRACTSPWGPAVGFTTAALAETWRESLAPASRRLLRRNLGELVSGLGSGEGLWRAYGLLAGDPEAIPVLLRTTEMAAKSKKREASAEELIEALHAELGHHRARRGDAETELRLLWKLMPLVRHTGRLSEFSRDLDRALDLAAGDPRRTVALSLLKAKVARDEGSFREAEAILRSALAHSEAISEAQKGLLLIQLGHLLVRQERHREAAALFERILPMLESSGLGSLAATCHFHLGNVALAENRLGDAHKEHERALAARRRAKAPKPISASLAALGAVCLAEGLYPQALLHYQEAEEMARQSGDETELAFALRGLGRALTRLGDFTAAAAPLRRCLELRQQGDDVVGEAVARLAVAENYLHLNNPAEALEMVRKAHFRLTLLGARGPLGRAEYLLGLIQTRRRRPEEARKHLEAALDHYLKAGDDLAAAFSRAALVQAELLDDQPRELAPLVRELSEFLESAHYPELGERLDLQIFRALERHDAPVEGTREPLFYLRRAYRKLMEKTAHLERDLRNRFLFQIPDHEAIVTAATHHGLEMVKSGRGYSLLER